MSFGATSEPTPVRLERAASLAHQVRIEVPFGGVAGRERRIWCAWDLTTGTVWPTELVENGQVEGLDPYEDPDPQLWLEVPGEGSRDAYRDVADFTAELTDPRVRGDLVAALDGKGAFRRFQGALHRHDTYRVHWRVFSTERLAGRARAWLAEQGYDARP